MTSHAPIDAVGILDDIIRDPGSRRQFKQHPVDTMRNKGANPDQVPSEVWATVTNMSLGELTAIAELGVALSDTEWLNGAIAWKHVV
jgi:hypothetical protein